MKKNTLKIITIFIYMLAFIAFSSVVFGFMSNNRQKRIGNGEIQNVVLKIYDDIDRGNYLDLYNHTIEGSWSETDTVIDQKKIYYLEGLVSRDDFIEAAVRDYGKNGWRLRFTELEITGLQVLSRDEFEKQFPREHEILNYFDQYDKIEKIFITNLTGYIIGNCSITDWMKKLPLIWTGRGWAAIVAGTPDDLSALHREEWLTDINFKIAKTTD